MTGQAEQRRGVSKGTGWGTLTPWLWIEVGSHSDGQQQAKRRAPSKNSGLACFSFLQQSKGSLDKCLPDLSQVKKGGGGEGARKGRGEGKGEEC